jgi:hypothetical protein
VTRFGKGAHGLLGCRSVADQRDRGRTCGVAPLALAGDRRGDRGATDLVGVGLVLIRGAVLSVETTQSLASTRLDAFTHAWERLLRVQVS